MIEKLAELVNQDQALTHRARWMTADMLIGIGEKGFLIAIRDGRIESCTPSDPYLTDFDFAIRGTTDAWAEFWQPLPKPRHNDLIGLMREGKMRIEGNINLAMSHFLTIKLMLEKPRGQTNVQARPKADAAQTDVSSGLSGVEIEPITGRYMHLDIHGRPHRLYWEEAGQGIPLLCLHTAGADGRQYRGLLTDPAITERFRVITFDMPWHGKSSPPAGWQEEEYKLTTDSYIELIRTVSKAMKLDAPVVMGCSIGGRIVLELARRHPDEFRAIIGLQSSAFVQRYFDISWLHRPNVHGGEMSAAYCCGLVGPEAPTHQRWETMWHYMQSGPGVFKGDLHFYSMDGDVSTSLPEIDTKRCPVFMLTGEYDYSCTPEASKATAEKIDGAKLTVMKRLGHFPMSEDPETFKQYLMPVLGEIALPI